MDLKSAIGLDLLGCISVQRYYSIPELGACSAYLNELQHSPKTDGRKLGLAPTCALGGKGELQREESTEQRVDREQV